MKVLFLIDNFSPKGSGGAGVVVYNLVQGFKDNGYDIFVITAVQDKSTQGEIELDGLKIFRIYTNYHPRWQAYLSLYNPQTISKVNRIIQNIKPDIVHAHNIHYHLSYHCLKIAKKYSKAVFLTAHDVMLVHYGKLMFTRRSLSEGGPKYPEDYKITIWDQIKEARKRYNPFRNIIIRYYLKYVDKIFAVSNSLKELLEINNIKDVETIYNGIDVSDWEISPEEIRNFREKYNLQNKKIIFFGGRLTGEAKGGRQILKALELVKKQLRDSVLLVASEKNEYIKELKKMVKESGLEENVIFTNWLEGNKLKPAYNSADICVIPSICFETFGMVNLEAMACKKPVISTFFGGPSEIVVDPAFGGTGVQTGYLINPYNIELIAEKIIDLLKNPEKAKRLGEVGYERVKNYFSLDRQVDETLKWYKKYV